MQRAHDLIERLLEIASLLGLYAEEYDPKTGRHLGNFPQAVSNLVVIDATARMILLEWRARL
jgi:GH15 family glucan-1,4-alpha-glucosidase